MRLKLNADRKTARPKEKNIIKKSRKVPCLNGLELIITHKEACPQETPWAELKFNKLQTIYTLSTHHSPTLFQNVTVKFPLVQKL